MSKRRATKHLLLRTLAPIVGVPLLTYLIRRVGPGRLVDDLSTLGWGLAFVIALGGVTHLVKAWAWRLTLAGEEHKVSFSRLLQLRLASEAVGQFGFLGQALGESVRVSAYGREWHPESPAATSLAVHASQVRDTAPAM